MLRSHLSNPSIGDYVLATKYSDGDPGDHFVVGFYAGNFNHFGQTRHLVNDSEGNPFRANGFRRVQCISKRRGAWLVSHFPLIEAAARAGCKRSLWGWARLSYRSLLWSFTSVAQ